MYQSVKSLFILALVAITFVACNKKAAVLNEVINEENLPTIVEKVKNDKAVTNEELELLTYGINRLGGISFDSLKGKTLDNIIELQREQKKLVNISQLKNSTFNLVHNFWYMGWKMNEENNQKFNIFSFGIQNKYKKDIKAISGLLKFMTSNNQLILAYPLNINQEIKAGLAPQFESSFKFDESNKSEVILVQLLTNKSPNFYPLWQPTKIEFTDGTSINYDQPTQKDQAQQKK